MKIKSGHIILFTGLSLSIIYFFIEKNLEKRRIDIKNNGISSVGKIFYINSKRDFTDARYFYFYNGKRYESGEYIDTSGDEYLNRYYRIVFSSVNPENSNILLNEEVKDSIEIKKLGF